MLKEIHKQPEHIRALFMWLCVIIVFSIIGYIWLIDFQNHLAALINPELANQQVSVLSKVSGPFAGIGQSLKDAGASLSKILEGFSSGSESQNNEFRPPILDNPKPQLFPE